MQWKKTDCRIRLLLAACVNRACKVGHAGWKNKWAEGWKRRQVGQVGAQASARGAKCAVIVTRRSERPRAHEPECVFRISASRNRGKVPLNWDCEWRRGKGWQEKGGKNIREITRQAFHPFDEDERSLEPIKRTLPPVGAAVAVAAIAVLPPEADSRVRSWKLRLSVLESWSERNLIVVETNGCG